MKVRYPATKQDNRAECRFNYAGRIHNEIGFAWDGKHVRARQWALGGNLFYQEDYDDTKTPLQNT